MINYNTDMFYAFIKFYKITGWNCRKGNSSGDFYFGNRRTWVCLLAGNWIPGSSCLFHFAGRRAYGRRAPPAELTICTTLFEHIKEKRLFTSLAISNLPSLTPRK